MFAQQIVDGLMLGSVYALVAISFTLTIGILGFLNLSIPAIFMIAAMATWTLAAAELPLALAALAALASGAVLSLLVERTLYRRIQQGSDQLALLGSMAFLILLQNLAFTGWGSGQQRLLLPFADASVKLAGVVIDLPQLACLGVSVGVVWALKSIVTRTATGRAMRTIAENEETAALLGVPVRAVVAIVFATVGALAALAGVLFAIDYRQVSPSIGEGTALKGVAAMAVGGVGSIGGAIAGGLIIGVVEMISIDWFGARTADFSVFALLLLFALVRPTGWRARAVRNKRFN